MPWATKGMVNANILKYRKLKKMTLERVTTKLKPKKKINFSTLGHVCNLIQHFRTCL